MKFIVVFRPRFPVIFKKELLFMPVSDDMFKVGDDISPYFVVPFLSPYSFSSSKMFIAPMDVDLAILLDGSAVGSSSARFCTERFMSMSGLLRIIVMLRTSSLCF